MEVEDMQDYNRQPRVRKFIKLDDLQQHTRHERKTKDLRDHKKSKSTSRETKTKDQRTKTLQCKKQSWKRHHQHDKHRPLATDLKARFITAESKDQWDCNVCTD